MAPPTNDAEFWREYGALQATVADLERRVKSQEDAAEATGQHERANHHADKRQWTSSAFAIAALVLTVVNIAISLWRH